MSNHNLPHHLLRVVLLTILAVSLFLGTNFTQESLAKTAASDKGLVVPQLIRRSNGKILFRDTGPRELFQPSIYTIEADGSHVQALPSGSSFDSSPTWSPDGTRILFVSTGDDFSGDCIWYGDCKNDLYVMNADGTHITRITNNGVSGEPVSWSPDGTRITFACNPDGNRNVEICAINADGTNQVRLTNSPGADYLESWSPDGTYIAFDSTREDPEALPCNNCRTDIYLMRADGSHQIRLTSSGRNNSGVSWSPDGKRIAYSNLDDNYNYEIYLIDADGTHQQRLTYDPAEDGPAEWSPNGQAILFVSDRATRYNYDVYVMKSDGANPTRLTVSPGLDQSPVWSPDGTRIAFLSTRDNNNYENEIYVMNADGSNQTRLNPGLKVDSISWQSLQTTVNPLDDAQRFVDQQYIDFLHRRPDPSGLEYWTHEITQCAGDLQCTEANRVNVSAAFFMSIEFQQTGYLAYRMYKAAYGDRSGAPVPLTRQEFLSDSEIVGSGVVVNAVGWEQQLENNKNKFADDFVGRARFTSAFPAAITPQQFVDTLNSNAGGALSQGERDQLVNDLGSGVKTRAQVLRSVAEDADLARNEFNKAFVLMQYFGYLGRNPNDAPDVDFSGYNFWLNKLNSFGGNFVNAEMVKSFIDSSEYNGRLQGCAGCWDY